ncbi:rhomboid family intramembrane serine protease [Flavitalea sp. BT771]|uniref:rhomboid family intramembrane serine protease n=1 Tax=Flavitalea sp. BT771 TaxID=3063329 RepID=UPI0026E269A4|nr:rhomboid family intramembrane serine protease [Flavitalea sp. BT771]MDO6433576.1 rhomboid family intramembrane serine protease [Flavitalea sp. BT771]MDV6222519.1 rhomboid family intramembrane serine protease [Flavitalea sp. BT771]
MRIMEDSYRKKMMLGQDGNALVQLIVINAVLFVILQFIYLVFSMNHKVPEFESDVLSWFVMPASMEKLSSRPWTILTYMFSEQSVIRFIGNMFWLWGFGYILQDLMGNRKLVPIYLYGGIAAAIVVLLSYGMVPGFKPKAPGAFLIGANPGIMAIAVATTTIAPDYRIFPMINGGIRLWIFTLVFLIIDIVSIGHTDTATYIANLTGAGAGFVFIYLVRRGYDGSIWMNKVFDWFNDLFNPNKKKKGRSPKDEYYYKVSGTQPYKKIPNITQQRIDEILDKINQQGYRFLTDEEKDILKRAADEEDL